MAAKEHSDLQSTLKEISTYQLDVERLRENARRTALLAERVRWKLCDIRSNDVPVAEIVDLLTPLQREVRGLFHVVSSAGAPNTVLNALEILLTFHDASELGHGSLGKRLYAIEHLAEIGSRWMNDLAELLPPKADGRVS